MKKYLFIILFSLVSLVSYSQVFTNLHWGMTKDEVVNTFSDCTFYNTDEGALSTYDIKSLYNYKIDRVIFDFDKDERTGLSNIIFYRNGLTLKEALSLRDRWAYSFAAHSKKQFDKSSKIAYYVLFDSDFKPIGVVDIGKKDDGIYSVFFSTLNYD